VLIEITAHPEGAVLPVRAHAGARRSEIRGQHAGSLKVSVTQVPEKGKANKAIINVLAKQLRLQKSQLELLAGATSSQKDFLVRGVTREELQQRVTACISAE
jgi:uncharacterized protein (TIGR00251 family)